MDLGNMRRIIVILAVFVILTDAHTPSRKISKCANVTVQRNFNSERYFKGTWYLTHAQHGKRFSVCRTLKTKLQPNGTIDHTTYAYRLKGEKDVFYETHCLGNQKKGKGRISLSCKRNNQDGSNRQLPLEGVVMETDYDHYSIFYRCTKTTNFIRENILVYNRKINDTSKDALIAKSLKKKGLALGKFLSRRKADCAPHPKE